MITEQAKQQACDLANAADRLANWKPSNFTDGTFIPGSMRALAQLCQDISDAVEADVAKSGWAALLYHGKSSAFILPKPAPDPLLIAIKETCGGNGRAAHDRWAEEMHARLAKSGYAVQPIKGEG